MRPTRAVVDLARIRHNIRALRSCTSDRVRCMAVVKADAYGHGAVPIARAALDAGASWLAVATAAEGLELRTAGVDAPVLVLAPVSDPEDIRAALASQLALTVCSPMDAEALVQCAAALGTRATVHVKVDTGMGRLGVGWEDALKVISGIAAQPALLLEGVFSHFATADEADLRFARTQLQRYQQLLAGITDRGIRVPLRHMANTAATMVLPESHFDMVRVGIGIYGLYPSSETQHTTDLRPALRWETAIGQLKSVPAGTPLSYGCTFRTSLPSRIATLPVGYADGYPRQLSNRGRVLVRGHSAPVVGRVCMDMILADVTNIPDVEYGDQVTLLGTDGNFEISADEIALLCDTIHYEVTCGIGGRVQRIYLNNDAT